MRQDSVCLHNNIFAIGRIFLTCVEIYLIISDSPFALPNLPTVTLLVSFLSIATVDARAIRSSALPFINAYQQIDNTSSFGSVGTWDRLRVTRGHA